jgi:hypothetical protein
MKRTLLFALIATCTLSACNKKDSGTKPLPIDEDKRCIAQAAPKVTDHLIAAADVKTVDELLKAGEFNYKNLRYLVYEHDTQEADIPPYRYDSKVVASIQYTNGLPIFNSFITYYFKNNAYSYHTGTDTKGTKLDTKPRLLVTQLRKLFVDDLAKYGIDKSYADSCMRAEFGYYNLKGNITSAEETLVKAWKVSPKGPTEFMAIPVAYYQDEDGKLIYFDNGFRTNE